MTDNYVVCETETAMVWHARKGSYKLCGKQDSHTLCGRKPAWDLEKAPVECVRDGGKGMCRVCSEKLR